MQSMVHSDQQELSNVDFDCKSTYFLQFPTQSMALRRATSDYEWTDFCPDVFRNMREVLDRNLENYTSSLRNHETVKQLNTSKKNDNSFQLSTDRKLTVKVISKSEVKVLLNMLPYYYRHLQKYRDSLLTKLCGLHEVKPTSIGKKVRFVVTWSILEGDMDIHKKFNIKGFSQCQNATKTGGEDLNICFHLQTSIRNHLLEQVKYDCCFLEEQQIVDYGFLLGMHVCATPFESVIKRASESTTESTYALGSDSAKSRDRGNSSQGHLLDENETLGGDGRSLSSFKMNRPEYKLGFKIPARAGRKNDNSAEVLNRKKRKEERNNVLLYFAMVDIFQTCNVIKHVGHVFKSFQADSTSTSPAYPKAYASNFQEIVSRMFPLDETDCL